VDSRGYFYMGQEEARPVLLMGHLDNPIESPIRWRDVGEGMTEAISRELRAEGHYDVWINPKIGRDVKSILQGPPSQRAERLEQISDGNPDVQYIFVGRVTDFLHEGDPSMRKSSRFFSRDETPDQESPTPQPVAFVAIDFAVIDIESQRTVLSDHIVARRVAGLEPTRDVYRDMGFGSYRFWDTPLGQASRLAISRVQTRLRELPIGDRWTASSESEATDVPEAVPTVSPPPAQDDHPAVSAKRIRIERQINPRKVHVVSTWPGMIQEGQKFFVSRFDPGVGQLVSVDDRDTGQPLRATIVSNRGRTGLALLSGLKPRELDLRGAILTMRRGMSMPVDEAIAASVYADSRSEPVPIR
jgi:hypothetical protein